MRLAFKIALFLCLSLNITVFAQPKDTSKVQKINTIDVKGTKTIFKNTKLYDEYELDARANIKGFYALDIYSDAISDEVWMTEKKSCIDVSSSDKNAFKGTNCLSVNWNKPTGGCDWIGLGFGWDGWSGKNMSQVIDTVAIEMYVKSNTVELASLPVAIGFEDYANKQAWIGFSSNFIQYRVITKEWTKITIPLSLFPFVANDLDLYSIKQMLIQFESEGSIQIDEIKLVPFSGKLNQSVTAKTKSQYLKIDGVITDTEWPEDFVKFGDGHQFSVQYDAENVYVAVRVNDADPMVNKQSEGNIWNGDAIELVFGANPTAKKKRSFLLLSDLHVGIKASENPIVWDWKSNSELKNSKVAIKKEAKGYSVEFVFPISSLSSKTLTPKAIHGFEIAVDLNGKGGDRAKQDRWNNPGTSGFNTNPSLWGEIILE